MAGTSDRRRCRDKDEGNNVMVDFHAASRS
jgi:hypothetical protein